MLYGPAIWITASVPSSFTFYAAYNYSTAFTVPTSGWYRVYCVGKSGDGGLIYTTDYSTRGGGGGGSGGIAISNLLLSRGEVIQVYVSGGWAQFGNYLYATNGYDGEYINGGTGGMGYGGNVANYYGYTGGTGGYANNYGNDGENSGMLGGRNGYTMAPSGHPAGGGGGGGAKLPSTTYVYGSLSTPTVYRAASGGNQLATDTPTDSTPYPVLVLTSSIRLHGGGGGQGGNGPSSGRYGGNRSLGTPAVVIIERAS